MKQTTEAARAICAESQENRRLTTHRFFIGFLLSEFRRTGIYGAWKSGVSYFRRLRTVALIIKIATVLLTLLQTGALVILSTVLFLILLPLLVAFTLGVLLTARIESRRSNRYLRKKLADRAVCVCFLSKRENPFLTKNAEDLTKNGRYAIVLLSPYWLSGKGIFKSRFYTTFREELPNVYLVRRYYFFSLKKHVLPKNSTYVY
jgi:hypothetical protein